MKSRWITVALCLVAVVILIVRLIPHGANRGRAGSHATRPGAANPYLGLRSLVLQGTRANFGLGPGHNPTEPFAVVSDWNDAEGTTTIIAVADGSASVYRSNGAGSIGGGQSHDSYGCDLHCPTLLYMGVSILLTRNSRIEEDDRAFSNLFQRALAQFHRELRERRGANSS